MSAKHDMAQLDSMPRKMVAMTSEALRKPLAEDLRRAIGQAIEHAILLSQLTKQDIAYRMGYEDQSALSRWISGAENAQFAKLWIVRELRAPLVVALAAMAEDACVTTTVTIKRTA